MDYPWYELIENSSEITQGDIVKNCSVPILTDFTEAHAGQSIKAVIEYVDGIILTQACWLANKYTYRLNETSHGVDSRRIIKNSIIE